MALRITCENGHVLNAPENMIGKKVKCPKCGVIVNVSQSSAVASPSAPSQNRPHAPGMGDPLGSPQGYDPFAGMPMQQPPPKSATTYSPGRSPNPTSQKPAQSTAAENTGRNSTIVYIAAGGISYLVVLFLGAGVWWMISSFGSGKAVDGGGLAQAGAEWISGTNDSTGTVNSNGQSTAAATGRSGEKSTVKPDIVPTDIGADFYAAKRFESKLLSDGVREFLAAQMSSTKIDSNFDWQTTKIRTEWVPFFLLASQEEEDALRQGRSNPGTKKRIELLLDGSRKLGLEGWLGDTSNMGSDAISERLYADMLALKWRYDLVYKPPTFDAEQVKLIRKIEDSCFGLDSAFYQEAEFLKDSETFAKISEKVRTVSMGINSFRDSFNGRLPSPSGAPQINGNNLSWRVAILPYIEKRELYQEFHLNEPWDSEHNKKLIELMPDCFDVCDDDPAGHTTIHVPLHANGFYAEARLGKRPYFSDGGEIYKIQFLVGGKETAEPWTKPGPLEFLPQDGPSQLGTPYLRRGYVYSAFDSVSRLLTMGIEQPELEYALFVDARTKDYDKVESVLPRAHGLGFGGFRFKNYLLSTLEAVAQSK